jgi:catechol-2,3-dioxygenase
MRIRRVTLTVDRPEQVAAFYRDVLQFPVTVEGRRASVTVGSSRVVFESGDHFRGVHHLAFGVSPADFELARAWLGQRVEPIIVNGSEVIEGPEGWDSTSVYFLGPEGIVLEFIARAADRGVPASEGDVPRPLCISEVGIGVPDVTEAVRTLGRDLGLPPFPPQEARFAPVGGHDGLIILVDQERIWFPTTSKQAANGPVFVEIEAPRAAHLALRQTATVAVVSAEGRAAGR